MFARRVAGSLSSLSPLRSIPARFVFFSSRANLRPSAVGAAGFPASFTGRWV